MTRALLPAAVFLAILAVLVAAAGPRFAEADPAAKPAEKAKAASEADEADEEEEFIDPLGPNAACYVCHTTFVHEEFSKVHKAEGTGCIDCHGLSAAHANDEHVGATPPDIVYPRAEIEKSCAKCHETHDAPAAKIVARFLERKLSREPSPVCTDCHGQHRIEEAAGEIKVGG